MGPQGAPGEDGQRVSPLVSSDEASPERGDGEN